jgi:hypothetical protein
MVKTIKQESGIDSANFVRFPYSLLQAWGEQNLLEC